MTVPAIRLVNVSKVYGSGRQAVTAVQGLGLEIPRGEFVSIMGPSGSGKSTLLNLIAGLDMPDSGQVFLNGQDIQSLSDAARARLRLHTIGFIFQAFNLLPALDVERNVAWPLAFLGCSRAETRERTTRAFQDVGIVGCERRYPAELSGGEQQRIVIARALVTRPSILLADEPTGNLDTRTGQAILELLRGVSRSSGATVVMVTHSVFAATYGDRTLEMEDGAIRRDVRGPQKIKVLGGGNEQ